MLTIHASPLRGSLSDAAPTNGNTPSGTGNDPAGFASLLRQTRLAPAPVPPAPALAPALAPGPAHAAAPAPPPAAAAAADPKPTQADAAPADNAPGDAEAPAESDPTHRARALLKGKLRAADGLLPGATGAKQAAEAKPPSPTPAGDPATEMSNAPEIRATATEQPLDPSLMHWLAGSPRAPTASADVSGDTKAPPRDGADALATESRAASGNQRPADLKADADVKDKAAQTKAQLADAVTAGQFATLLTEERRSPAHSGPIVVTDARSDETAAVGAAGASAFAPASTAGTGNAAPVPVAIATPVTAPDFAQELGLRLSVLAKDGVQTAELHLNPADMGPVSVQIVMDGTQARVDFGADVAATRQAIEAGLPELASALRDAGFTLAGGGVSQHAGGRNGGNDSGTPDGGRRRGLVADDEVKRVATAARRIVSTGRAGGVDLFA